MREGTRSWNQWRTSNPDTIPSLDGLALAADERGLGDHEEPINLSSARLRDADLRFVTLSSANLEAAEFAGADLSHARLQGAHLRGANFSRAILDHADLTGADLRGANFYRASLRFANLSAANLKAAKLSGADLTHAKLSGCDLTAARLTGSNLRYADMTGAKVDRADLRRADLQNAKRVPQAPVNKSPRDRSPLPKSLGQSGTQRARRWIGPRVEASKPGRGALTDGRRWTSFVNHIVAAMVLALLMSSAGLWWLSTPVTDTRQALSPGDVPFAAVKEDRKVDADKFRSALAPQLMAFAFIEKSSVLPVAPQHVGADLGSILLATVPPKPTWLSAVKPQTKSRALVRPDTLTPVSVPTLQLDQETQAARPLPVLATPKAAVVEARELLASIDGSPPLPLKNAWRPPRKPLTLVVSLQEQDVSVYRGATEIAHTKVSTG
ncbi:MAG TPA: pentapeptide repeat-containing protein, partial [Hyphomicrobiaceae bacterium]|nr:pentapeptide repeat-containing protein [Hyphomicrobiaceae bacterium]